MPEAETESIIQAAALLADNRCRRGRLEPLPATCRPATEEAGYRVQCALRERLRAAGYGTLAGYKIGATSQVMQDYLNIHTPCGGSVLTAGVHPSPTRLSHQAYVCPGVECELAVRLGTDLPPEQAPFTRAMVAAAVAECMAGIEVVDDRYADWRALDTPTLIADDFFHAGVVLGPTVADWRRLDLARIGGRLLINGTEVGRGWGGDVLGHPFDALIWLANHLARFGQGLHAGQIVMTGSIVATHWVKPGARVAVELEGLGTTRVEFV
jgi:2-keto-4-pentenoate hydratase